MALARERPARMVLVSSPASSEALHGCGEKAKGEGAKDVQCLAADFKDGKQVDEMCSKAGAVDVLINCGGVFGPRGEDEQGPVKGEPSDWEDVMCVNVAAPMRIVRRLGPSMCDKGNGLIINIGDVEGEHSGPCHPAYAASAHVSFCIVCFFLRVKIDFNPHHALINRV
jgi:NAD(P)-dependent dehydrogenase (short-subunit alcohol dehydrogenase family)